MNAGVAQWSELIQKASQATGVPASVIAAVMTVESGGNAQAKNPSGATGLMQIMPSVWNRDGKLNLYDPYTNILKGAQILAANYRSYGSWNETFQRYYGVGNRQVSGSYAAKVETALKGIPQEWGSSSATSQSVSQSSAQATAWAAQQAAVLAEMRSTLSSLSQSAVPARPMKLVGDLLLQGATAPAQPSPTVQPISSAPPRETDSLLDGASRGVVKWQQQTRW